MALEHLTKDTFKEKVFNYEANKEWKYKGLKPAIIDFYADWCIPCKELDAVTFSDEAVIKASKEFENYKADFTKSLSPEVEALRDKYKIAGVPTILILDSNGNEVDRITGFVSAKEFLKILSKVE